LAATTLSGKTEKEIEAMRGEIDSAI